MPYSKANKVAAKQHVAAIRSQTVCKLCGCQPIEWHHVDHERDSNQRVAHLTALGFPIARIDAEIAKSEALCRRCHQALDGRRGKLRQSCPNYLPGEPARGPCADCQRVNVGRLKRGLCARCYSRLRAK